MRALFSSCPALALALALALPRSSAHAGPLRAPFAAAASVDAAELDACRGGFTTPSGLTVTLGIERIVTVDGHVAARSGLQLGDLGRLVAGTATPTILPAAASDTAGLTVRLGPAAAGAAVIQNSLDGRAIASATIIDATVGAQGMLQALHFQSTLAAALNDAVTRR